MALFKVDGSKFKPKELLPAEVPLPAEVTEAEDKGDQTEIHFRISEGQYSGRTQYFWLTNAPKSEAQEQFILGSLLAFGYDVKKGEGPESAAEFIGKQVVLVLKHEQKKVKNPETGQWEGAVNEVGQPDIRAKVHYLRRAGNATATGKSGW